MVIMRASRARRSARRERRRARLSGTFGGTDVLEESTYMAGLSANQLLKRTCTCYAQRFDKKLITNHQIPFRHHRTLRLRHRRHPPQIPRPRNWQAQRKRRRALRRASSRTRTLPSSFRRTLDRQEHCGQPKFDPRSRWCGNAELRASQLERAGDIARRSVHERCCRGCGEEDIDAGFKLSGGDATHSNETSCNHGSRPRS